MDAADESPAEAAAPKTSDEKMNERADQYAGERTFEIAIDPHGDVVLEVRDHVNDLVYAFLVSTKILSFASPVFTRMFSPGFKEGQQILSGDCPHIRLDDDDPFAMEKILQTLHLQGNLSDTLTAQKLATLAIHCDKYHCVKALGPWVSHWFGKVESIDGSSVEIAYLVLAAYMFDDSEKFKNMSKRALLELGSEGPPAWEEYDTMELLPATVPDAILLRLREILAQLHDVLENVETSLRQFQVCYAMENLFCVHCGRTLPTNAKKCHPCNNTTLEQKYCTRDTRISDYFALLRKHELWPTADPFNSWSVSQLVSRLGATRFDTKHSCAARSSCPLEMILMDLTMRSHKIRASIDGICLQCVKSEEWNKSQECTHCTSP